MPAVPKVVAERLRGRPAVCGNVATACTVVLAACGGAQVATPGPVQPTTPCVVATRSDESDQPITVGLTEPVDPAHAPEWRTESERILFRLLYETLLSVDCNGHLHPGLASVWRSEAQNRVWIFTLREQATFWDGTEVSPSDVVTSWRARATARELVPRDSISVLGEHDVRVAFAVPPVSPAVFAHRALAIVKRVDASAWPMGTTPFEVGLGPAASGGLVRIHDRQGRRPFVEFVGLRSVDARDFLDRAVDVLVTDESTALDYAATRASEFLSLPLPWHRTYVALSPDRIREGNAGAPPARVLDDLARNAVRVEARAATSPFWWEDMRRCHLERPSIQQPRTSGVRVRRRIVYNTQDAAARSLAERLVALAGSGDGRRGLAFISAEWSDQSGAIQASAFDPGEFGRSVREGSETGYILALPRSVSDPCTEAASLVARIPWLGSFSNDLEVDLSRALVPMIDVRLRAVLRRGRVHASTDWDGTFRVVVP